MIASNHQPFDLLNKDEFALTILARFAEAARTLPHGIGPPDRCLASGDGHVLSLYEKYLNFPAASPEAVAATLRRWSTCIAICPTAETKHPHVIEYFLKLRPETHDQS